MVPMKAPATTAFFLLTEGRASVEGQAFAAEVRKRSAAANVILVDTTMSDADLQRRRATALRTASQYVVAAFASVAAYRGSVALGGGFPAMLQNLVATKKPVALIALGNPYLLRSFPGCRGLYDDLQHGAAFGSLGGEGAVRRDRDRGKACRSRSPGLAQYGDGIGLCRRSHPVGTTP